MTRLKLSPSRALAAPELRQARKQHVLTERMQWRAQMFRRLVQLMPSQSILEIGENPTQLTQHLRQIARGENSIARATLESVFGNSSSAACGYNGSTDSEAAGPVAGRTFDCIVGTDVLSEANCESCLRHAYDLLEPGGNIVLFESRSACGPHAGVDASPIVRDAEGRHRLQRLAARIGLVCDIVPFHECSGPISSRLASTFPSFPLLADTAPAAEFSAGCFVVHARRPPVRLQRPIRPACEHKSLYGSTSCVVPCFNEEMNLEPLVNGLLEHYGDYIHEIILVDDNSFDGTRAVMLHLAEKYPRVRPVFRSGPNGVGRAIAAGYRKVTGRYVLSLDCDFQQILPEIRDLFDAVADGADVAIGSRFSRSSVMLHYPFLKLVANRGFHMLARGLFMRRFHDVTNNLKLMRRDVLESLELSETGFAVNAQTGLLPILDGYTVREIPVSWINRDASMGASSFRLFMSGAAYSRVLLRLWGKSFSAVWSRRRRRRIASAPAPLQHAAHTELKIDAHV